MSENKKAQIAEELEISIQLKNFSYSGVENDHCVQSGLLRFFGRAKEKSRLLDHLREGKGRDGSFLIAGYRGAGKTRFVYEVLCDYEKEKGKFIEVRVNLGNDGDLTSKSLLFNMIYLLNNQLRDRYLIQILENEKPSSFNEAVYTVRFNLGNRLKKNDVKDVKDVSSRVLDLLAAEQMAIEQYRIIERMGDLSSSDRTSILRNKHYLDDDYEDNMFILDWSYCRFFAPSAMVHGKIIENKMELLRKKFGERMENYKSEHPTV